MWCTNTQCGNLPASRTATVQLCSLPVLHRGCFACMYVCILGYETVWRLRHPCQSSIPLHRQLLGLPHQQLPDQTVNVTRDRKCDVPDHSGAAFKLLPGDVFRCWWPWPFVLLSGGCTHMCCLVGVLKWWLQFSNGSTVFLCPVLVRVKPSGRCVGK